MIGSQIPFWVKEQRPTDDLLASALAIIDSAANRGARYIFPLFSGGHDSLCACYIASQHEKFDGEVHHIDTTIGARATRVFIEEVCAEYGWRLRTYRSNFSYERFVQRLGFPGPGSHSWVYRNIKDRCVSAMIKGKGRVALISGARQQESTRRMGYVEPITVGEKSRKTGEVRRKNRIWTSPCFDWSTEEQRSFLNAFALPRNPIKESPLAMSGECFCGAFARPGEIALIRRYAPDVAEEIDRLSELAVKAGTFAIWGTRRKGEKGILKVESGPMCSSCDQRANAAGLLFDL